jgi:DNA adenine methylase
MERNDTPDFDGSTYDRALDRGRLAIQLAQVKQVMLDGRWRTLEEISVLTSYSTLQSISARLRDLRKEKFGNYIVDRRRKGNPKDGLFEYRVRTTPETAPVLKWAGGKRKLVPELLRHIPKKIDCYAEPFVGGGALFFAIWKRCKRAVLIDKNKDLVVFYRVLRDEPQKLMRAARCWPTNDEKVFYEVRALNPRLLDDVNRAARVLFLNKTCFNGLWRVNATGRFNTPYGHYKDPTVVDEPALFAASKALQRAKILHADFEACAKFEPDCCYLDPPYDVVSDTANFTSFTTHGFDWKEQIRLETWANSMRYYGKVVLSNADTERVRQLYGERWKLHAVKAARAINSNGAKRGKVGELIIT